MVKSGWPRILPAFLLGAGLLLAGCDTGPSGPGELTATVQAPGQTLGGVVLEVTGKGVETFSGSGNTRVLWAATDQPEVYRVVAINQNPGSVQFQVSVQDVGADKPRALIVNLIDGDNAALTLSDAYSVSFAR